MDGQLGRRCRVGGLVLALLVAVTSVVDEPAPAEAGGVPPYPPNAPVGSVTAYQGNALHDGRPVAPMRGPLEEVWSIDLGSTVTYPLVVGDRIFVVAGGRVWAIDREDGVVRWGPIPNSGAVGVSNGIVADSTNVYSLTSSGVLRAYGQHSGEEAWSRQLGQSIIYTATPTVRDGVVYVTGRGIGSGRLYAVEAATGALLWSTPVSGEADGGVAVTEDAVFLTPGCGHAYRFDLSGAEVWHRPSGCSGTGGGTPVVHDGAVYARSSSAPAVLDVATGSVLGPLSADAPPAFSGGTRYVLRDGSVRAVDVATGDERWAEDADGGLRTAPLALGDVVAVGSASGTIFLLDAATGSVVWSDDTGIPILAPNEAFQTPLVGLAASDDLLLVPAGDTLVAYAGTRSATSTVVTTSPNPSPWREDASLVAHVTPSTSDGTVSFYADGNPTPIAGCADVPIEAPEGSAACATAALESGPHLIEAQYSGDDTGSPSTGSTTHTVAPIPPTSITGTVTNRGGDAVDVFALDAESGAIAGSARVRPDGTYEIAGVPTGEYLVYFGARHRYWGAATRSDEAWSDAHGASASTPIEVSGDVVTGIDAHLEAAGKVEGRVTTGAGTGVGGALVEVVASGDTATQEGVRAVLTDDAGYFSVPGLDVGSYDVAIDRDFDGSSDASTGDPFVVAAGATVDLGTFAITLDGGLPSKPSSLSVTPGVGRARLAYGLPNSPGVSPLEVVTVTLWPFYSDVTFSDDSLRATAVGLLNGVSNRFAVTWTNGHGRGLARVVDAVPTGCSYLWFTDVPAGSPFCADIRWLVYEGISEGYDDATFRPGDVVSRQALAAFLYRFAGSPDGSSPECSSAQFGDVPVSHPFCGEIAWLVEEGITAGFADATFRPGDVVSRQAMAAFLYRFAGSPDGSSPECSSAQFGDVPVSHPFCGEIAWLVEEGITTGFADGTFRPTVGVSRQMMAAFLQRLDDADLAGAPVARTGGAEPTRPGLVVPSPPTWSDPTPPSEPVSASTPAP